MAQHSLTSPPPFIILVPDGGGARSVLQGTALHGWLSDLLDAFLDAPGTTPGGVLSQLLEPYLGPHIIRLAQYALSPSEEPRMAPPAPEPKIIELPDADAEPEDGVDDDTSMAIIPARQENKKVTAAGVMGEAKAREKMLNQRAANSW